MQTAIASALFLRDLWPFIRHQHQQQFTRETAGLLDSLLSGEKMPQVTHYRLLFRVRQRDPTPPLSIALTFFLPGWLLVMCCSLL